MLKCRFIPKIKFPEKGSPTCKITDRGNFESMTDEQWFEWSGEPVKVSLSTCTKKTTTHLTIKPTPIMIYAKEIYSIPYTEYKLSTLIKAAKVDLGVDDESKLIPMDERIKNFELFRSERFNSDDPWGDQLAGVFKNGTSAYNYLMLYSKTSYGSIMIDRINKYDGKFVVYLITKGVEKFQAMGASNHIRLPEEFPIMAMYPSTGDKIDPLAVIHHEFEHTIFGKSSHEVGSLEEEVAAVKLHENPVRIINGFKPRYSYYQRATDTTVSVFDYKKTVSGSKTTDPLDPRLFR